MHKISCLIGLLFTILACKTYKDRPAPSEKGAPLAEMNPAVNEELSDALVLENGESLMVVKTQDLDEVSQELRLQLTSTEINHEDVLAMSGGVLAGIAAAATAVAGAKFVKGASKFKGGSLGYLTTFAPESYFRLFKWKNEMKVKYGSKLPYHEITRKGDGATLTLKDKTFKYQGSGDISIISKRKIYLGILPSEDMIKDPKWTIKMKSKMRVIPVVKGFEGEYLAKGLDIRQVDTPDNQPVPIDLIDEGVGYIDDAFKDEFDVYVHCKSGVGRSATIVAAWYIKNYGMSAIEAGAFVKSIREEVVVDKPGHYHQLALQDYEIALKISQGKDINLERENYRIDPQSPRWRDIQAAAQTLSRKSGK